MKLPNTILLAAASLVRRFSALVGALIISAPLGAPLFADVLNGTQGFPVYINRYTNTGNYVPFEESGYASIGPVDALDCMTTDNAGNVYGVGHSSEVENVFSVPMLGSGKVALPPQLRQTTDIEFAWDQRLLVTSHTLSGNGLTGILELDPSTNAFVQNLIPASAHYLGFSPFETNSAGFRTGTLYVGNDAGTTERYRLTTGNAITKDASFSIPSIGNIHFRPGDATIFMENGIGDSILQFDPATGASLGTLLTLPGGGITDFVFGDDNSVYVLRNNGPEDDRGVFHFSPDGTALGFLFTPFGPGIAFASVPEAGTLGFLGLGLAILVRRRKMQSSSCQVRHSSTSCHDNFVDPLTPTLNQQIGPTTIGEGT